MSTKQSKTPARPISRKVADAILTAVSQWLEERLVSEDGLTVSNLDAIATAIDVDASDIFAAAVGQAEAVQAPDKAFAAELLLGSRRKGA